MYILVRFILVHRDWNSKILSRLDRSCDTDETCAFIEARGFVSFYSNANLRVNFLAKKVSEYVYERVSMCLGGNSDAMRCSTYLSAYITYPSQLL